ncbi:MAG: protein kinase [Anaerolineales bacterium]|nr:protein kinase [Anaerolineales bacterium]
MSSDSIIGRNFANFRVLRHLGHGGMADVYYGYDVKLERPVAIKVLDTRYRNDSAWAKRFVREARAIALWRHENIIQVYYAGDEDGFSYFVMEYIDGKDLATMLSRYQARRKLIPHDEVIRIGRAVANALDYAHQKGVVHRDVKPSNIMVAKDGRVVLMDFGLALDMTEGSVGEVFGSANYISPEQARNSAEAVPQSDLYSLGVVLYEMLVGQLPFDDPSFTTVAIQHITTPPPPPRQLNPELSEAIEAVLLKALHKSPEKRYKSAGQLMDALEKTLLATSSTPAAATPKRSPMLAPTKPAATSSSSRAKRAATSATTSARPQTGPATSSAKRPSLAKRTATPPEKQPTGSPPAPTEASDFTYQRLALVVGGLIILIVLLVLVIWLLSA